MPTERSAEEIVTDDKDECYCGDYRIQHREGSGPCQICSWNHYPGIEPCQKFRLSRAAGRIKASDAQATSLVPSADEPEDQHSAHVPRSTSEEYQ